MPEIGRRLFRHDEPATVEIEGMDQHQIIRQPRIFNRQAIGIDGIAVMRLDRFIAMDRYSDNRETGSFILIDSESGDTVGLGIIETTKPSPLQPRQTFIISSDRPRHMQGLSSRLSVGEPLAVSTPSYSRR